MKKEINNFKDYLDNRDFFDLCCNDLSIYGDKDMKNDYKIMEDNKEVTLICEVPGLKKEDIKIVVSRDAKSATYLKITGETKDTCFEKIVHKVSFLAEIDENEMDIAKASSIMKNGILYISIPKKEKKEIKDIVINII